MALCGYLGYKFTSYDDEVCNMKLNKFKIINFPISYGIIFYTSVLKGKVLMCGSVPCFSGYNSV